MMKNDQLIASIFGHTINDYADAGNAAIVHLNTGDKVYVKAHDNYNHALFGKIDQIYTTLTGELLFADNLELDVENFNGPVGFSAIMTKHAYINDGSTVIYDKAITNIGSAYNTTTGTFTAPFEGTYLFHFHALALEDNKFWLELFHNEHNVISSYGYTDGCYADAGNTAILHLKKGDMVKTKSRPGTNTRLYGASDEFYTTFCGALLSPTIYKNSGQATQQEIAFSAGLTHNEASSDSSKMIFDRVFLNHGLSFNANTGVFTAPVAGIYVFHYHALTQNDKAEWVELYHNYIYVNSLYAHTSGGYGSGSNSAALELDVGDTVYLDIQHRGSFLYGGSDNIYCTFSGYLLSPIARHNPVVG
ncbi:uncharacterized protein LOC133187991 [Saccostrea echinata]|uniref:uncharacterized protein LOC133187991 n=1 Tax=Saccostrea echinata TaxID=191078 RepID=UPI002A80E13A|nr:uncharacterized protein LOC133187991 [Saccostrea echinata]